MLSATARAKSRCYNIPLPPNKKEEEDFVVLHLRPGILAQRHQLAMKISCRRWLQM